MNTSKIDIPVHAFEGFPFSIVFFKDLPTEYQSVVFEMAKGSATTHLGGMYIHDAVRFFRELNVAVTFQTATFHPTNSYYSQ